jgi:uncharacterized protein with HEPN domain
MTEEGKKFLFDVLRAIERIEMFSAETPSFVAFSQDLKTQSAVERQLVIIGEAMNALLRIHPEIQVPDARQIVGLRHRLVHAYDSLDNAIVWAIVQRHIPALQATVMALLNRIDNPAPP